MEMPGITSRICGICPASHLLTSAKAGDDILAVEIPESAENYVACLHLHSGCNLMLSVSSIFLHRIFCWASIPIRQRGMYSALSLPIRNLRSAVFACESLGRRSSKFLAAAASTHRGQYQAEFANRSTLQRKIICSAGFLKPKKLSGLH